MRDERPDLWAEVVAARSRVIPTPYRVIAAYLVTCGISIGMYSIKEHFLKGHGR